MTMELFLKPQANLSSACVPLYNWEIILKSTLQPHSNVREASETNTMMMHDLGQEGFDEILFFQRITFGNEFPLSFTAMLSFDIHTF